MFIIAVPQYRSRGGPVKRFKAWRARKDTVQLNKFNGITFYTVAIKVKNAVPDYRELLSLGPRFSGRLLMAEGLSATEELQALLFTSAKLPEHIMLQVTAKVSDFLPIPLIRRCIGLVDEDGIYTDFAEKLIKHSPTVKIFTKKYDSYEATQKKLLALYGAPLIVTNRLASLADCQAIYSPNPQATDSAAVLGAVTVTGGIKTGFTNENILSLHELCIPQEVLEQVPLRVDPIHFLSAAYELCGKREYDTILPKTLLAGRQVLAFSSLSDYIKKQYKAPGVYG